MKQKLIIVAILVALTLVAAGFASPQSSQKWEYKVLTNKCNDEKRLNALGADGWELTTYSTWPISAGSVDTCVFKRPQR